MPNSTISNRIAELRRLEGVSAAALYEGRLSRGMEASRLERLMKDLHPQILALRAEIQADAPDRKIR